MQASRPETSLRDLTIREIGGAADPNAPLPKAGYAYGSARLGEGTCLPTSYPRKNRSPIQRATTFI